MGAIFLNAITIAMETTSLSEKIPTFFTAVDNIFLGIYLMEFVMKIYAEPLAYWKNYYNLFDFSVLVISSVQSILAALNFGQTGLTVLKVIRGKLYKKKLVMSLIQSEQDDEPIMRYIYIIEYSRIVRNH